MKLTELIEKRIDENVASYDLGTLESYKYLIEMIAIEYHNEQLNLSGVVKSLEIKEEIVFEDWLKQHRFTKDINDYVKNNITYREWEVFNMYTMDVYNL